MENKKETLYSSITGTKQRKNDMTSAQMKVAIKHVAKATSQTENEVAAKLFAKDDWTWFLLSQTKS